LRACASSSSPIDPEHPEIEGDGIAYEGRRYRAEARLAGKIYGSRFGVDAAFGDVLTTAAQMHDGTDFFAFAGIARTQCRIYPREAHIAEKLHAYTLPRKRENTRVKKLPIYQRERVAHVWLVDPIARTLEIFRLDGDTYRFIVTYADEETCRAEPFDAIELELGALWRM